MGDVNDQVMQFTDGSSMRVGDYIRVMSYQIGQLSTLAGALRSAADNVQGSQQQAAR